MNANVSPGDFVTFQGFSAKVVEAYPAGNRFPARGLASVPWERSKIEYLNGKTPSEVVPTDSLVLHREMGRIGDARAEFVNALAEIVSEALLAGVSPEEVQTDVDGCLSIQLPIDPGSSFPAWVDTVLDARQIFEAETAAQFADGSGEMEMAGYPAGE